MHSSFLLRAVGLGVLVCSLSGCPISSTPGDDATTIDGGGTDANAHDASTTDGGADSSITPDSGNDAGQDASIPDDASVPDDAGHDAAVSEPCTTPGAIEHLPCGLCGTLDRFCTSDHAWAYGACTGEHGECSAGATSIGPCGRCGQQTLFCETTCTWTPFGSCVGETGTCTPGTTTRVTDGCPAGQSRVRTCDATCALVDAPCEMIECATGDTMTESCGMCGTRTRTCDATNHWVDGACFGEGACMPGATMLGSCEVCGTRTSTCDATCQWQPGTCSGGVTCAPPPSPSCVDAMTLRTYFTPPTCVAGGCSYAPTNTTCPAGCMGTACVGGATLIGGLGGATGYGPSSLPATDDGSSPAINLTTIAPTGLNFYGTTYTTLFVNNNGNVSFGAMSGVYHGALPLATSTTGIIALFLADTDTRVGGQPAHNNVVWYTDATRVIVTYDRVGYFAMHNDRENSYQLILTARPDRAAGDFDIEMRYGQCQWLTGDPTGEPASAGLDAGDHSRFIALPGSSTATVLDLCTTSNVGTAGVWRYEVRSGVPTAP